MVNEKPVAQGVTRSDTGWSYVLQGSKDALISSGMAQAEWFVEPGKCDKRGHVKRSKRLTVDGRKVQTMVPARGPCSVWMYYTDEEKKAAERIEQAERQRALARPGALRKHVEDRYMALGLSRVCAAFNIFKPQDYPWMFSSDVQDRALKLCRELLCLFYDNEIILHAENISEGDTQFQRFMQTAMMKPQDPDGDQPRQ